MFRLWPRRALRPWLVAGGAAVAGLVLALAISEMEPSGAAVIGWPAVWAAPLLPLRALGVPLDEETAFWLGFPLMLAANAVAVVATAYAGLYASGRRTVGIAAAAALAVWPLVSRLVAGDRAWENGTWLVDTGPALYTEPLSTALVATALALLLRPGRADLEFALAGVLLSYATLVKVTNGLVAAAALAVVAVALGARSALPLLAGGSSFALPLAAFWPMGYDRSGSGTLLPDDSFSLSYAGRSWTDSILFSPRTLAVLVPLAVVGALALRRRRYAVALLLVFTLANAVVYTFYAWTPIHPRFLFASLPAFFVLWAAGLAATARRLS